jgi:hypothetical protein
VITLTVCERLGGVRSDAFVKEGAIDLILASAKVRAWGSPGAD